MITYSTRNYFSRRSLFLARSVGLAQWDTGVRLLNRNFIFISNRQHRFAVELFRRAVCDVF